MVCPLEKNCDVCSWYIRMYKSSANGGETQESKCVMAWTPLLLAEVIKTNVELIKQGNDNR